MVDLPKVTIMGQSMIVIVDAIKQFFYLIKWYAVVILLELYWQWKILSIIIMSIFSEL